MRALAVFFFVGGVYATGCVVAVLMAAVNGDMEGKPLILFFLPLTMAAACFIFAILAEQKAKSKRILNNSIWRKARVG